MTNHSRKLNYSLVDLLAGITGVKLIFPFFHAVEEKVSPHLKHAYPVRNVKQFEKDLDYLLKHFNPVDYNYLLSRGNSDITNSKKAFLLSFDDGLSSIYHHVAPILKRKGIPAIFFVNNLFIDNRALFFRYKASLLVESFVNGKFSSIILDKSADLLYCKSEVAAIKSVLLSVNYFQKTVLDKIASFVGTDFNSYLSTEQPYLTYEQLNSLIDDGFTIGAHSLDHPKYNELTLNQQLFQTLESVRNIQNRFSVQRVPFSFPFTDFGINSLFFDKLSKSDHAPVLSFGTAGIKRDSVENHYHRIPIEKGWEPLSQKLRKEYLYFIFKMLINKNRVRRQ